MAVYLLRFDRPLGAPNRQLKRSEPRSLPRTRCGVPLTLREKPGRYALPAHLGDGARGEPPTRSWRACPVCGGSGRVRYTEPHPVTGERIEAEEPPALPAPSPAEGSETEVCEMCDGIGYPPHFAEPHVAYGVPFPLGRVVATPGALALAEEHGLDLPALVARHQTGDWGTLGDDDRRANDQALRTGARLLSRYPTRGGVLWIITEADRSATTVLLPEEY